MLSAEVGSATPENLMYIILFLGIYLFPVNVLSEKKRTMRHGTRNQWSLKLRLYTAPLIDLNKYSDVFPGEN